MANPRAHRPHPALQSDAAAAATPSDATQERQPAQREADETDETDLPPKRPVAEHVKFWAGIGRQVAGIGGTVGRFMSKQNITDAAQRVDEFCEDASDAAPILARMLGRRRK